MQNNQPLVSVIMNCFNGDTYLKEAIDSVISQTYQNWEIIFWDNASTDDSAKIAQSYDSKVKYFHTANNTPLGRARVSAIDEAKGEYLAFLDCDDLWKNDKLEKQISAIRGKTNVGLVYSRCEIISGTNELLGKMPQREELPSGDNVFDELVKENFIPFVSALISRQKYDDVGGFPAHYKNSTDYHVFLKISYTYKVIAIDEVLCKYREHSGNLSHSQYVIGAKECVDSVSLFLPDQRAIIGIKYQYVQLAISYVKEKQFLRAFVVFVKHGGWLILIKRLIVKGMIK
jgi:glycosyltransferase involved in cell wall biosynthesis